MNRKPLLLLVFGILALAHLFARVPAVAARTAAEDKSLFLPMLARQFVGAWHYIPVGNVAFAYIAGGDPAAYVPPGTTDHRLFYRAADDEIDELHWFDGSWKHQSLTLFHVTAPRTAGDPAAYITPSTGSHHVYYRGTDSGIHELWLKDGNTIHAPIGQLAGAAQAAGDPTAYVPAGTTDHRLFYRGTDNHIHELAWTNGAWAYQDISQAAGSTVDAAGDPNAYVTPNGSDHYVFYRGSDNRIHALARMNGAWTHQKVSELANSGANVAGDPVAYITPGGDHYVYYRGTDNRIHALARLNGTWTHQKVSELANTSVNAVGNPSAYVTPSTGAHHVFYRGTDDRIHELWWNADRWHHLKVGLWAGSQVAVAGDPIAYVTPVTGSHHVFYRGVDSQLHELWWTLQ